MHIKTASSNDLLKETIHMLKGFFGRMLFGKPVISSLTSGGANIETITKVY